MRVGQRPEDRAVDDREDGGVGADPERERQDRGGGTDARPSEKPEREPEILQHASTSQRRYTDGRPTIIVENFSEAHMSLADRQRKARVLDALTSRVRQFRTRHDLWPLRVPREPVVLDAVIEEALGPDRPLFDQRDLRAYPLLQLEWDPDGDAPASRWVLWVLALPSNLKLYCDSDDEESRVLASVKRDAEGGDTDAFFLELFAESAGGHFGIEMAGGAPARVRTTLKDREFLITLFVDLLEVTSSEDSVRQQLSASVPSQDFRTDVAAWLDLALR